MHFTTHTTSLYAHTATITLNRPDKANAMNAPMLMSAGLEESVMAKIKKRALVALELRGLDANCHTSEILRNDTVTNQIQSLHRTRHE